MGLDPDQVPRVRQNLRRIYLKTITDKRFFFTPTEIIILRPFFYFSIFVFFVTFSQIIQYNTSTFISGTSCKN